MLTKHSTNSRVYYFKLNIGCDCTLKTSV